MRINGRKEEEGKPLIHRPIYSPIAHWLGDGSLSEEIEGVKDYSLTTAAGTIKYGPGIDGRLAFYFNGADRLTLANTTDKADFQNIEMTVAMWYQSPVNASQMPFAISSPTDIDANDNDVFNMRLASTGEKTIIGLGHDVADRAAGARGTDKALLYSRGFTHLILRRSGTGATQTFRGYIHGAPAWTAGDSSTITKVVPGSNSLPYFGGHAAGGSLFTGILQSIMLWNTALTDAQMKEIVRSVGVEVIQ